MLVHRNVCQSHIQAPSNECAFFHRAKTCVTSFFLLVSLTQVAQAQVDEDPSAKLSALPCSVFSDQGFAQNRWMEPSRSRPGSAPFGVPYIEWTDRVFNALRQRARQCGNPNIGGSLTATETINVFQKSIGGHIEQVRRTQASQSNHDERLISELDRISQIPDTDTQITQLERLVSQARGTPNRTVKDKIQIALETAQERRDNERQLSNRAAQEQAAANQKEDQRRTLEQQQRIATEAARSQALEAESRAKVLRNQQMAENQAERDRKQLAAEQAAADSVTAARIAQGKRNQEAAQAAADRAEKAAQEQASALAAANKEEDQRRVAEQEQRLATIAAQSRAAEAEAQAQNLRNQQAAADQAVRDRKRLAAAQAAADQAASERIAKEKRDQIAAEAAAEEAAAKMPKPMTPNCTDSSLIENVKSILAKNTSIDVFKVYSAERNPEFSNYVAAPALERVQMSRQIFSVPQCYAMAMTSHGEMPISYRVFKADGDTYINVNERQR